MNRAPLAILVLTIFLDLLGFGLIIPILPYLAERYGASPLVVTALMASYSLMQVIFAPIWGRLSDRIGRRPIILGSLCVSTVGFFLLGSADTLWMVFVARILSGIGNANLAAAQAYVADVTGPEDRARGMGLLGMAFGLGFIFGPAVGGYLGGIDLALPAFAAAGLTALDLALAAVWLPEPTVHRRAKARGLLALGAFRQAISLPDVGRLFAVIFIGTFAFAQLESTFGLFVEHRWHRGDAAAAVASTTTVTDPDPHQRAARDTGTALFVVGVVAAIVQGGLIGRLTRRFGERRLIVAGLVIEAVGLAAVPKTRDLTELMVVSGVIALGNGLLNPSLQALLSKRTPGDRQGEVLGVGQSLSSLARVGGPILGGALFQSVGIGAPYTVGGAILLLAALAAIGLSRALPAEAQSTS